MDIEEIRRIEFRPGDRLVLRVKGCVSVEAAEGMKKAVEMFAPGVPVLVLDNGHELDVLSGEVA